MADILVRVIDVETQIAPGVHALKWITPEPIHLWFAFYRDWDTGHYGLDDSHGRLSVWKTIRDLALAGF